MPGPSTSKQRAYRIDPNYYHQPDRLTRVKRGLTWLAALGAIGWGAWGFVGSPRQHSPGLLAAPHAMWENQCSACHADFVPLAHDAVQLLPTLVRRDAVTCQQCHQGAVHHFNLKETGDASCVQCHFEHRGRNAQLTKVDDRTCVECHADLPNHAQKPELVTSDKDFPYVAATGFTAETHPPFRSTRRDPGRLKFSHRLHLMPGLRMGPNDKKQPVRLRDLPADLRELYRADPEHTDFAIVELDCSSCHTAAPAASLAKGGSEFSQAVAANLAPGTLPTTGDYMLPVNFERHCRACHALEFYPGTKTDRPPHTVPHGLPPKAMDEFVRGAVLAARVDGDSDFAAAQPTPARALPGKALAADIERLKTAVANDVATAEKIVNARCTQCHEAQRTGAQLDVFHEAVAATNVPAVWLQRAKFAHAPHRGVSCKTCHEDAYPEDVYRPKPGASLLDDDRVLMPKLDVCVKCHAPRNGELGGARFDCVECHRFHGADLHPVAAQAQSRRLPHDKKTDLESFLRGPRAE
jgi:predicted CXXCH cytochrome family protein